MSDHRFDDVNLPENVVGKITREVLPQGVEISKDAQMALSKAASVFILYLTSSSSTIAEKNNRKTLIGQDVIKVLSGMEFCKSMPLQEALENFKKSQKEKKEATAKRRSLIKRMSMEQKASEDKSINVESHDDLDDDDDDDDDDDVLP